MSVIVNESNISKQLSEFWNLENLGIEAEVSDEENIDNDIMSEFEAGIFHTKISATIKHHLKKYVDIFPDTFNHLNQSLYVDDFLSGNVSVQAALTTCIESKQILEDASMDLRKWRTNSYELNQSTKATHLEVVSDLTTEAFLACLRRFIAKRSKPSVIWSDNATNFKGARNILSEWNEICKSNRIQLFSAEEGIEWNFMPPASPHFGGLWEANIKSMKRILLRVAKSAIMNFEELTTLMAQIEAVLNSRPLSPLSSDPNDLNPLTPGHSLTNCAISSFPEPYTASDSLSYHSRWKLIQSLRDKFWNRWSTEYLTHLQTRAKWSVQNPNLMENRLVLLKDPNTKPLDWPMRRILEVFPGSDGLVRVVNVKTSTGILKRAITKVVPLPIPVDPASVEKNI
ncbi:integrase catalytic domain-containing protein [Trichonephila clavipes]|nr:integrase catalytic domain-containing protein [Trichonephila clavipes]